MGALATGPGRYSPHHVKHYDAAAIFEIFRRDQDAWNLGYLSWDWEANGIIRDPYFSTHVLQTLNVRVWGGRTVRYYLQNTPPRAVYLVSRLPIVGITPLFQAHGQDWIETMERRARQWREPDHPTLDFPVNDFTSALEVIRKL